MSDPASSEEPNTNTEGGKKQVLINDPTSSSAAGGGSPLTWDQARFLLEQGKVVYHSWTSTDAGLPEFKEALNVLDLVDHHDSWEREDLSSEDDLLLHGPKQPDLETEVWLWIGHAHAKLKHFDEAEHAYATAIRRLEYGDEKGHGHYCDATGQAYLALSKMLSEAGKAAQSLQAAVTAARIEHYLHGIREDKSFKFLQQTLRKEHSPEKATKAWPAIQESVSLEVAGDKRAYYYDYEGAFDAYSKAADVERDHWGMNENVELPLLLRKAFLARGKTKLEPGTMLSGHRPGHACRLHPDPRSCLENFRGGDSMYFAGDSAAASKYYSAAIRGFEVDPALNMESCFWWHPEVWAVHGVIFFMVIGILFMTFHMATSIKATVTRLQEGKGAKVAWEQWKVWAQANVALLKEAMGKLSGKCRRKDSKEAVASSSVGLQTQEQKSPPTEGSVPSIAQTTPALVDDESSQQGQEILPSVDESSQQQRGDHPAGVQDDVISSSVLSLGRALAGFDSDHDDLVELNEQDVRDAAALACTQDAATTRTTTTSSPTVIMVPIE